LVAFNINSGESRNLGLIGSGYGGMAQGENLVLDDEGCVWCAWSLTRAWQNTPGADAARLCKFDPREDRIHFYQTGLPWPDGRHGYAKPEAFFNFGDGFIYASGANGSLYRVDTQTGKAEYLFTPTPNRRSRLSAMVKIEEGVAYGVTGRDYNCEMMRVNYKAGTFEKIGKIVDDQGNALWQCHDLALADDGVLYVCENDNPYRSAYLWEVTPK
jgi:outer membrane protein assembly factor BamB